MLPPTLPDLPRASSRTNDNHCMTPLQGRLLAGSLPQTLVNPVLSNVKSHVVPNAHTVPGHSQKKDLSPGPVDCIYRKYILKSVKSVSCVIPLSCVQPATSVKHAASNPPVGARLQNFWQTWLDLGAGPKIIQILREGYTLPFRTRPNLTRSPTVISRSSQEQLPVGGITSAYEQKCDRTGPQSNISGVFQPTLSSPQTQQPMETNTGFKQTKPLPQGGEIQNGDTRNHQDIPPTRGVGHLSRLQGCLLPHTDTGTIQEIPKISCPGPDLSVQGTALWSVHSAHGVHCTSQRGKTDGHTQGYKNPPVPRRLVGEGQIPRNLSPAHPDSHQNVPGPRLAGEFGKIRTGTQTGLQFCRLPVRPQVRPGQTDSGPVAKPSGQSTDPSVSTGLSGSLCP